MKGSLFLIIVLSTLLILNVSACVQPQQSGEDLTINPESILISPTPILTSTPTPTPITQVDPLQYLNKVKFEVSFFSEGEPNWLPTEKYLRITIGETLTMVPEEVLVFLKEKPPINLRVYFKYKDIPEMLDMYGGGSVDTRRFSSSDLANSPSSSGFVIEGSHSNWDILTFITIRVRVYSSGFFEDFGDRSLKKAFATVLLHELAHALEDRLPQQIKNNYAKTNGYLIEINESGKIQFVSPWEDLEVTSFLGLVIREPSMLELESYGLPTVYSATSFSEDFAEAFSLYFLYPEYLRKYGKTRYEFMNSWLGPKFRGNFGLTKLTRNGGLFSFLFFRCCTSE